MSSSSPLRSRGRSTCTVTGSGHNPADHRAGAAAATNHEFLRCGMWPSGNSLVIRIESRDAKVERAQGSAYG